MGKGIISGSGKENETKYKVLFELAPIGISIVNSERRIVEANRYLEKVARISRDELISGKYNIRKYLNSKGTEMQLNEMPSSLALNENRVVKDVEIGITTGDDEIFWTEVSAAPLNEDARLAVVITQDITEKKILWNKLTECEIRRRILYENSLDAILLINPDFTIYDANPAACKMLEMTENIICSLRIGDLFAASDHSVENFLKTDSFKGKDQGGFYMIKKNGIKFPVEISTLITKNAIGDPLTGVIIRDISDQKIAEEKLMEIEEKYRLLSEQSGLGIGLYSPDGKVLYFNKKALSNIGGNMQDYSGKSLTELFGDKQGKKFISRIRKVIKKGKSLEFEDKIQTPNGKFWYLSNQTSVCNKRGELIGVQVLAQDITERKKTEEKLIKASRDLRELSYHLQDVREAERAKIAQDLHDDFGQRLTALKIEASSLRLKIDNPSEDIEKKINDILDQIDGTIESARRISSGMRPSILDHLGIAAAIEWQVNEFTKSTGIISTLSITSGIKKIDTRISTTLFRILQEALTNIAKHSKATQIEVSFKANTEWLYLNIQDNGTGITRRRINNPKSFGLKGMKERAISIGGILKISCIKGKGTHVLLKIPNKFLCHD
jgi:PAS domain S-box-containing protein